jgi:protein TonB
LISLVLHGGLVAIAMQVVMDVKPHLQPATFRWDVALHQLPAPSPVAADSLPPQESVPKPTQAQPATRPASRSSGAPIPQAVERTAVVRTVQSAQVTPRAIERSAPLERQAVVTEVQPVTAQPVHEAQVAHAQEVVRQERHDAVHAVEAEMATAHPPEGWIQESAVPVEALATAVDRPAIVAQAVVETEASVVTSKASRSETQDTVVSALAVAHRSAVAHREVRETAPADLGWLAESLWTRIEQLKRYPRQARARRWEGKVVLEAVIRHDGTILECLVAESSGHGLLDQDAISVLRKASPLALKHPLGKDQITILVPIAYRLEG